MMTRFVFFPFTYMTRDQQETLEHFFVSFSYLSLCRQADEPDALKAAVDSGRAQRIAMPDKDLESAALKTQGYMQWASIHKGNEHNLKAIIKDSAYFTSDTHVSSIKSQITGDRKTDAKKTDAEVFENNLLFLTMAHLCDEQNEQIDVELQGIEKSREKLYTALKGLDDSIQDAAKEYERVLNTDNARIMTRERIAAWACCLPEKEQPFNREDVQVFVTTSPSVFDYFESNCSDVVNALDINQIKVHENNCELKNEWQHQLENLLVQTVHGGGSREIDLPELSGCCSLSGQIKMSFFSGDMINTLFGIPGRQMAVCLVNLK